jgi:hypothetical protein
VAPTIGELTPRARTATTVLWVVVNAVNLLQTVGFATRAVDPDVNRVLGWVIVALAVPATWSIVVFVRERAGWLLVAGPLAFDLFVLLSLTVDYGAGVEFREPALPSVLVPYLALFFGSILLMGLPMFRLDRRRWLLTVATTAALLVSMGYAIRAGVG